MRSVYTHRRKSRLLPCAGVMTAVAAAMVLAEVATGQIVAQPAIVPNSPNAAQAIQAPADAGVQQVIAYPLDGVSRAVFVAWQKYAAGRQDLRVAIDERTSQVIVFAMPAVHAQIRQQLATKAAAAQPPAVGPAAPAGTAVLELRNLPAAELHPRLERLLARPLPATLDASGEWKGFAVEASPGNSVTMNVNTRTGQVRIDGPPLQVAAWKRIVAAIDSPTPGPDSVTQLVVTKPANHERVRKTLQALQTGSGQANQGESLVATRLQQQAREDASVDSGQPGGVPGQTTPQASTADAQTALEAAKIAEAAGGLLGPVQVEFVEGLDVIVIRGSERDVQRVLEIINQIEQLSEVTVPAIEIHPLQHAGSVQIAALLARLYVPDGALGSRIGTISITPLAKPNALLLIGRTENVKMAIELIQRLDQPVVPTSQFEVFRLKHASAPEAKTLIDTFLGQAVGQQPRQDAVTAAMQNVPTLATRALVVADPRTNALIVSAAPRDLAEIAALVARIDTPEATAEIHPLQHAGSVQIAALLARLYVPDGALGSPIGTISITPLAKPNALLLIGRTENVKMAIELIQRLDQPVVPTSQFAVFRLKHASALEAKTLIDTFLGQAVGQQPRQDAVTTATQNVPTLATRALVVADPRTNALIVSAAPRDLAEIAALVTRIDTPGAAAELKVFTIINGDATALVGMLRSLFSVPEEPGAAPAGRGLGQGGPVRMQFSVDPRTNSIIAAGSREDLAVVEAILLRLDEGDLRERVTTVHRLNNAFAEDVARALNQWLQTERQVEAAADLAISPFEQIEREVIIVPELATNSLIVSATPRFYNEIIRVIRELDERPPMVLIQVLIAEVRLNDTDEFGIELGLQDSLLFDRSLLSEVQPLTSTTQEQGAGGAVLTTTQEQIISANGQPGFNFNNQSLGNNLSSAALATAGNVAAQGLSSFSLNRVNGDLGFGGFVFSASSNSVSVLLRALQEKRRLEVLSRPQLMALDGQPGQVQVGQNVPRILATSIDPLAGTVNTITYEPVGLILQVVPRISPDGLVVMQITANKSEVGPEAEGIPISISPQGNVLRAPRIEVTQALTTVSALSGQTVVLGGLLQTRKFDVHRRVPLLADIPLLGSLFRYDSVSEERRELLIVLTPQIIYNKCDADLVKQIESSRMSWILSDVIALHGEAGLRSRCDEWYDGEMESVYPSCVPEEGVLPLSSGQLPPGAEAVGTPVLAPPTDQPMNGGSLPAPALPPAVHP